MFGESIVTACSILKTGTSRRPLRHAVVMGGSFAGLLAARVLSDHVERVTILERDELVRGPEPHKSVPQGHHLNALLVRGQLIAEALLPGLTDELVAAGSVLVNGGREFAWYHLGGWRVRYDSDLFFLSLSRPLLESRIAERVRALPNVTVLDGVRTIGLRSDGSRITGVRLARAGGQHQTDEIEADLVVDATGRGSSTPQWLTELGFSGPETELFGARVTYSTCTFRRSDERSDWRALMVSDKTARRGGSLVPIEGGRWLVTLPSFFDEPSPQDHDAFLAFARSLAVPDLYDVIRTCEPMSEIKRYRFVGSLRRRYERLERFPEGLIVIGDAVCSFNPVYAQGMTVSVIEAEALNRTLACVARDGGIGPDFARRWFQTIKPAVDVAWNGISLEDLRFPELAAQRPFRMRPVQWYMERVHRATHRSPAVTDQFYRVLNFLDPPSRLFRPSVITEILFGGRGDPPPKALPRGAPLGEVT
ncbi:NAD(P)/FAD-dependent oxidoreductase [Methylobacterium sp. WSM2598]|uniref:NAD(P)/FAD-dependent oxidoreductase n=1 Tax=Methylobacterium sp. WSM2598 TaxID=398261 RepID=UPI000A041A88|nr:FAD-dependent monooxygenase [Methylobacterium sp. WSM2598]